MPLRHEPGLDVATWFTDSDDSWIRLSCFGPSGFAQYGRLLHTLDPGADETDDDALVDVEGHLGREQLLALVDVLGRHTSTPDDCFFALWEGFGDIHGSPSVAVMTAGNDGSTSGPVVIPPAFPAEVMDAPRLSIPGRSYFLFRGPLAEAGTWPAADLLPGHPRDLNSPNLMWPADHSWFTATEIDQPWTGVAGSAELIAELLADPTLDFEEVEPSDHPPYRRS